MLLFSFVNYVFFSFVHSYCYYVQFWVFCFIVLPVYCLYVNVYCMLPPAVNPSAVKNRSYTLSRPKGRFLNETGFPA